MRIHGFDVYALSSPGERLDDFASSNGVHAVSIPMRRGISPLHDVVAVVRIWRHLRRVRPLIVHAATPKGGLLGMIGARMAGVPVCIYHVLGLRYVTTHGLKRSVLRWTEKASCRLADHVLCVSISLREEMIADGLGPASETEIEVLLGGSVNGVDADVEFDPVRAAGFRGTVRLDQGIPDDDLVVGFIGRIVRDKGMVELARAWTVLRDRHPDLRLMVVGPFEAEDPVPSDVAELFRRDPRVHLTGEVYDTAPMFAAMDVFALPTYREGLPTVLLEAAAMELPVVATRTAGCVDAVQDGVTGTLVPPRDAMALADAIQQYLQDPALRRRHGAAGRARVLREFRREAIWKALYQDYVRLLQERGVQFPKGPTGSNATSAEIQP
jgi:glycosyltransferase involved in cell wall biosynthesis